MVMRNYITLHSLSKLNKVLNNVQERYKPIISSKINNKNKNKNGRITCIQEEVSGI
jgi:hypothetical protein